MLSEVRLLIAATLIGVVLVSAGRADDPQTKTKPKPVSATPIAEQIWEGKLSVGAGLSLRIVMHIGKSADGKLTVTMDSPDQGARGLKVDSITLDKATLAFEMKALLGKYEGKLNTEGTEAAGTWTQAGHSLPLTLKKTDKVTERRRPQTPKPPFPYKVVEVSYQNKSGGVTLAGTLTEPAGSGPFPALILISGSGAQDRDETIFEHKPFLVLADALTRRGVAVLRLDDRGVGGSTGSTSGSTSEDFAGDVLAGIAFLKTRSEIDGTRLGLLGHSEGGIIAPMVAVRSPDVAFIVLMAGTGLPGEEILYLQGQAVLKAMGADEKTMKNQLEVQKRLFAILKAEKDEKTAEAKMRQAIKPLTASLSEEVRKALGNADALIDSQLKMIRTPWFRYFRPMTRGQLWRKCVARYWHSSARRIARFLPGRTCPRSSQPSRQPAITGLPPRSFPVSTTCSRTARPVLRPSTPRSSRLLTPRGGRDRRLDQPSVPQELTTGKNAPELAIARSRINSGDTIS